MSIDIKLILRKSEVIEDWWLIERATHDGREWFEETGPNTMTLRCSSRISDADVEGSGYEMLAIAEAIEKRTSADFKRCSVDIQGDVALFESPRNSQRPGVVSYASALELAADIRSKVIPDPSP